MYGMRGVAVLVLAVLACKAEEAKQSAARVTDQVSAASKAVVGTASEVASAAAERASSAYVTGRRVKSELDKVYETTHDYELAVDDVAASSPEGQAHAHELAALPSVTVGDATIGYEEDVRRSVGGATYSKQFRASWRRGDQIVRVSYFTSERIDLAAFAELLKRLAPIVERTL